MQKAKYKTNPIYHSKMQRVQKILSNYGYCSRREAEELIKKGSFSGYFINGTKWEDVPIVDNDDNFNDMKSYKCKTCGNKCLYPFLNNSLSKCGGCENPDSPRYGMNILCP